MKTIRLLLAGLAALLVSILFAGCQSRATDNPADDHSLINQALDRSLPRSHKGYARFEMRGQYVTIVGDGDGFVRGADGWTYTWITYRRILNVPWFSGLSYENTVEVTLGTRPR